MGRQGNKYEQTVAFILVIFKKVEEKLEEVDRIYLQEEFELPISKKIYKTTLKNVEVYIDEYKRSNPDVKSIRLDRISHVKIYDF